MGPEAPDMLEKVALRFVKQLTSNSPCSTLNATQKQGLKLLFNKINDQTKTLHTLMKTEFESVNNTAVENQEVIMNEAAHLEELLSEVKNLTKLLEKEENLCFKDNFVLSLFKLSVKWLERDIEDCLNSLLKNKTENMSYIPFCLDLLEARLLGVELAKFFKRLTSP